jgi:hypothetical protein
MMPRRSSEADFLVRGNIIEASLNNHPQVLQPWLAPVPSLGKWCQEDTTYREAHLAV